MMSMESLVLNTGLMMRNGKKSFGGGIYTIVETNGSWGKLKSGKGWINISSKYCKRVK